MARTVPSWSWTTWAILASVPTVVELGRVVDVLPLGLALGDERDQADVGDGGVERVRRSSRGRPGAGTIISGKMTVSRRATSGSSRVVAGGGLAGCLASALRRSYGLCGWPCGGPHRVVCAARAGVRRVPAGCGMVASSVLSGCSVASRCGRAGRDVGLPSGAGGRGAVLAARPGGRVFVVTALRGCACRAAPRARTGRGRRRG